MWIGRASKTLPSGFDSYTSRYEFFQYCWWMGR